MVRIAGLDTLRGLAIAAVFVFHVSIVALFDLGNPSWIAKGGALFGWVGVDLFFVLSGYLITRIALTEKHAGRFFLTFWVRRCLRILPAYYVLLFLLLIVGPALGPAFAVAPSGDLLPMVSYWVFASNLFMAQAGDHGYRPLAVTWSLAIEMQFYLFWPPIVRFVSLRMLRLTILALLVAAFLGRVVVLSLGYDEIVVFVLTPLRLDSLLAGALIACLEAEERALPSPSVLWRGVVGSVCLLAGGLLSGLPVVYANPVLISFKYTLVAVLFTCVLSLVLVRPARARQNRFTAPLAGLGRISYGVYLWHYTIILAVAALLVRYEMVGNSLGTLTLLLVASGTVSIVVATVSWIALERPALRLRRLVGPLDRQIARRV